MSKHSCNQIRTLAAKKYGNYVHLDFQHVYQWNTPFPATPRLREVAGKIPCASFW